MDLNDAAVTALAQSLVRIEALSGAERPVIDRLADEMRRLGFDQVVADPYGSLIGEINGQRGGPTLLLDAHADTVGVAPGVPWTRDPFSGHIEGGRLYGRGASDMKGALAAMIHAAAAADRRELAGRVVISVTVMEEVMEGVALGHVMSRVQPDFVVVGEATQLNINHGGRGRAELHLEAVGRPAHSSTPHLGINAVHLMMDAVRALECIPLPSDPLLGPAILALTDIMSEPYPGHSVIPSRCRATFDRRLMPGESLESVTEALAGLPEMARVTVSVPTGEYVTYTGAQVRGQKFFPAWKLPADHPFVHAARDGLQAAGIDAELGAFRFCTNAAYSAGLAGVPTIGFGPSTEGHAHQVDEHIELDQVYAAARGYLGIIRAVLGQNR